MRGSDLFSSRKKFLQGRAARPYGFARAFGLLMRARAVAERRR
jgi:hypothetical protein